MVHQHTAVIAATLGVDEDHQRAGVGRQHDVPRRRCGDDALLNRHGGLNTSGWQDGNAMATQGAHGGNGDAAEAVDNSAAPHAAIVLQAQRAASGLVAHRAPGAARHVASDPLMPDDALRCVTARRNGQAGGPLAACLGGGGTLRVGPESTYLTAQAPLLRPEALGADIAECYPVRAVDKQAVIILQQLLL